MPSLFVSPITPTITDLELQDKSVVLHLVYYFHWQSFQLCLVRSSLRPSYLVCKRMKRRQHPQKHIMIIPIGHRASSPVLLLAYIECVVGEGNPILSPLINKEFRALLNATVMLMIMMGRDSEKRALPSPGEIAI